MKKPEAWIGAAEAIELLQVRPQTLYANVSRGRIRARPDGDDPRRSRYRRDDVLRLAQRRPGRRALQAVASGTIAWGEPVLPSAVSTVAEGRLLYRGQDAVLLSQQASLEDVAALLWGGEGLPPATAGKAEPSTATLIVTSIAPSITPATSSNPITRALVALAQRATQDLPSLGRTPAVLREDAARVFAEVLDALIGAPSSKPAPAHRRLATAWGRPRAQPLLRRALVLLADHELNASTFAARVAVSTGASLAAGVLAGLATLTGPLHGNVSLSVARLVERAAQVGVDAALREAIEQDRRPSAFGHPLYPQGDPRAAALLAALPLPPLHAELARRAEALIGEPPNVDFALSALTHALRLPAQAPLVIFAAARCVGWLAHGIEQALAASGPIRPRARYVGEAPRSGRR